MTARELMETLAEGETIAIEFFWVIHDEKNPKETVLKYDAEYSFHGDKQDFYEDYEKDYGLGDYKVEYVNEKEYRMYAHYPEEYEPW